MTKRCERCGKDVDDAPFCPNCWTRLEPVAEKPVAEKSVAEKTGILRKISRFREKTLCFDGRTSCSEFWLFLLTAFFACLLLLCAFVAACMLVQYLLGPWDGFSIQGLIIAFFVMPPLMGLAFILGVALLAAAVRRFHDVGLPGWILVVLLFFLFNFNCPGSVQGVLSNTALLFSEEWHSRFMDDLPQWYWTGVDFFTVIVGLFILVVSLWRGTQGPNKFGPQPQKKKRFVGDREEPRE